MISTRPNATIALPAAISFLIFGLVVFAGSLITSISSDEMGGILFIGLFSVIWFVVTLIAAVRNMFHAKWLRAGFLLLAILVAGPLGWACWSSRDYAHLLLLMPYYMSKAEAQKQTKFDWGSDGGIGIAVFRTLIYDPNDRIPFQDETSLKKYDGCRDVRWSRLVAHFYLVETIC